MKYQSLFIIFLVSTFMLTSSAYAATFGDVVKNIFSSITGRATDVTTTEIPSTSGTPETTSSGSSSSSSSSTTTSSATTTTTTPTTIPTATTPTETTAPSPAPIIPSTPSSTETTTKTIQPAPVQIATSQCPVSPQPPNCPQGQALTSNTDKSGCVVGFQCTQSAITPPTLEQKPASSGTPQPIPSQQGQLQCPADEQQRQLKEDCYKQGGNPIPFTQNGCVFYNCQFQQQQASVQPGQQGPQPSQQQPICSSEQDARMKQECSQKGGNPIPFEDPPGSGCIHYNCQFQQQVSQFNPLSQQTCPSENEITMSMDKCKSVGGTPSVSFSGDCKIPQCIQKQSNRPPCPEDIDPSIKQRITQECQQQGGQTYANFDSQGCTITVCGGRQGVQSGQSGPGQPSSTASQGASQQPGQQFQAGTSNAGICSSAPPVQAVTSCQQQGGQLVTQTDKNGCITNAQCITRGDIRDTYVESVSQVPDTTILLDVAFSMEQLKMKLDQMSRQTNDIAAYYTSVGSTDAQKYARVSQMFQAAVSKVGDIQMELRDRLNSLNTDDITKIKSDIRYVKDVMMKDALYLMLTNDNSDTQSITTQTTPSQTIGTRQTGQVSENDCGNDGYCFDQAVRICKPIKFNPGSGAPDITIVGLQNNACIVEMTLAENQGPPAGAIPGVNPPYTAKCKLTDYALGFGIRGPQDMSKYCTGSLVEMAKLMPAPIKQGTAPLQPTQQSGQGGVQQQSGSGGKCDCTWQAGTPEHPTGCTVLCNDYSFSQAACTSKANNGCVWSSGGQGGASQPAQTTQGKVNQPLPQQQVQQPVSVR